MRILGLGILAFTALAQDSSVRVTSEVDLNGRRLPDSGQVVRNKSGSGSETTERTRTINGRTVPLERVEERVVRDDASGKITERITKRFDPNGNISETVKETIDEQKRSDGSSTVLKTSYRSDINGGMQLSEKSTTETRKVGSNESSETVVQRPSVNGSLDVVEKRSKVVADQPNGYSLDETISRRDGNGGFSVAVRNTKEHTEQNGQLSDNTAEYERGSDGRLQLHGQTTVKTTKRSDGTSDSVVDVFGVNVPGTVGAPGGPMKLQEEQVIQTKPTGADGNVQTISVRRPTASDPNTLGPARQISETTCKGKCTP